MPDCSYQWKNAVDGAEPDFDCAALGFVSPPTDGVTILPPGSWVEQTLARSLTVNDSMNLADEVCIPRFQLVAIDPTWTYLLPEQHLENSHSGAKVGPWVYEGKLFVVLQTGYGAEGGELVVFKSTDGITWTEVDSGNRPATLGSDTGWAHQRTFNVARNEATLYVAYAASGGAYGKIAFVSFSMETETWGTSYVSTTEITDPNPAEQPAFWIAYRPINNDLFIVVPNVSGSPLSLKATTTGTFSSLTLGFSPNLALFDVAVSTNEALTENWINFFYYHQFTEDLPGGGGTQLVTYLCHRTIDKDDTVSAEQKIQFLNANYTAPAFLGSTSRGYPTVEVSSIGFMGTPYADSKIVAISVTMRMFNKPFTSAPEDTSRLVVAGIIFTATPAASPSWSETRLFTNAYDEHAGGSCSFRQNDGTMSVIFANSPSSTAEMGDERDVIFKYDQPNWAQQVILRQTQADEDNGAFADNFIFASSGDGWNWTICFGYSDVPNYDTYNNEPRLRPHTLVSPCT